MMPGWLRRRLAPLMLLLLLQAGCTTLVPLPRPAAQPATAAQAQQAWSRVLARFVDDQGEVDFQALASDRADLDRYVSHVAETALDSLPDGRPRLAHMINAYNALAMFNVLASGIPASHAGLAKLDFFVLRKLRVGGQVLSLYDFENQLIRPYGRALGDPRLHFALNCMALGCPTLPRQPFTAQALDAELERETLAFFARPMNWRIDHATATVWLSELLNFYPEDFVPVPAASLLAYAKRYAAQAVPDHYRVRFTPYDWTVANSRRAVPASAAPSKGMSASRSCCPD